MSTSDITAIEVRATSAYTRADALGTPAAVRAADRAQPRFDVLDTATAHRASPRPARANENGGAPPPPAEAKAIEAVSQRAGRLIGAFAAFVTQAIAQRDQPDRPPQSAFQAGTAAYRQTAAAQAAALPDAKIFSPFPRLASGRTLDLSV